MMLVHAPRCKTLLRGALVVPLRFPKRPCQHRNRCGTAISCDPAPVVISGRGLVGPLASRRRKPLDDLPSSCRGPWCASPAASPLGADRLGRCSVGPAREGVPGGKMPPSPLAGAPRPCRTLPKFQDHGNFGPAEYPRERPYRARLSVIPQSVWNALPCP
jgi:hypothetical protein